MDLDAQIAELEKQVADSEALQQQQQQPGGQQGGEQSVLQRRFAKDSDDRSIYVANLPQDPNLTPEEVAQFFSECGPIVNCTLLRDRATGQLKGTAYIEFSTYEATGRALDAKQNVVFRGQNLTVCRGIAVLARTLPIANRCFPSQPSPLKQKNARGGIRRGSRSPGRARGGDWRIGAATATSTAKPQKEKKATGNEPTTSTANKTREGTEEKRKQKMAVSNNNNEKY